MFWEFDSETLNHFNSFLADFIAWTTFLTVVNTIVKLGQLIHERIVMLLGLE